MRNETKLNDRIARANKEIKRLNEVKETLETNLMVHTFGDSELNEKDWHLKRECLMDRIETTTADIDEVRAKIVRYVNNFKRRNAGYVWS